MVLIKLTSFSINLPKEKYRKSRYEIQETPLISNFQKLREHESSDESFVQNKVHYLLNTLQTYRKFSWKGAFWKKRLEIWSVTANVTLAAASAAAMFFGPCVITCAAVLRCAPKIIFPPLGTVFAWRRSPIRHPQILSRAWNSTCRRRRALKYRWT